MSSKTFRADDALLEPAVKAHIASLYTAVDARALDHWAAHFTEDAVFKKGPVNVQGRAALLDLTTRSWATLASRDHVIAAVFPFNGPGRTDEAMLHGRSYNTYTSGATATFTWAARMRFAHGADGSVLIDRYTIIVDTDPATIE